MDSLKSVFKTFLLCTGILSFFIIFPKVLLTLISILFILTFLHYGYCHWTPLARKFNKLPGTTYFPLIGCTEFIFGNIKETYDVEKGPFVKLGSYWLGHKPIYFTTNLDIIQEVLNSSLNKSYPYDILLDRTFGRNSVLHADVSIWKPTRKVLVHSFKTGQYPSFLEVFNRHTNYLIEYLNTNAEGKEDFNIGKMFGKLAMDISLETMFDKEPGPSSLNNETPGVYEAFEKANETAFQVLEKRWLLIPPLWHLLAEPDMKKAKRELKKFIHELTGKTENNNKSKVIYNLTKIAKDEDELYGQIITMMAGTIDTTFVALTTTLLLIAGHPRVQDKLWEELNSILPHYLPGRNLEFEDLSKMKYLDMTIKEGMRIVAPAPVIGRKLEKDLKLPGSDHLVIPKGTNVVIPLWLLYKREDLFPEQGKFIPERFSSERKMHPAAYIPFSTGPRNCIGQKYGMVQMKVALAKIILQFEISTKMKHEDELFYEPHGPFLKFNRKILISFKKRFD